MFNKLTNNILESNFFNTKPKFKKFLELLLNTITSTFNSWILAIYGIILTFATYNNNNKLIFISTIIYLLIIVFIIVIVLISIMNANYLYIIKDYSLEWNFDNENGISGNFNLDINLLLKRTTNSIHFYYSLNEYIDELNPFSNFYIRYEGQKKKIQTIDIGNIQSGSSLNLHLSGKKNIPNKLRKDGDRYIEIPIDVPIEKISLKVNFNNNSSNNDIEPNVFIRKTGELILLNKETEKEISIQKIKNNGYNAFICNIENPTLGISYLINW